MSPWTITWGTRSWTDDDALGADMAVVQMLIGGGWAELDPWAGPLQLMAWIAALEARTSGRDAEEVIAEVRDSPAEEVVGALAARSV